VRSADLPAFLVVQMPELARLAGELGDSAAAARWTHEADAYWRGPVWVPATVLVEDGLRRGGDIELADQVSARFRTVCEKSGSAENFDALTGQGLRDRAHTRTASAYLLLVADAPDPLGEVAVDAIRHLTQFATADSRGD
jgi:hypothetical protein